MKWLFESLRGAVTFVAIAVNLACAVSLLCLMTPVKLVAPRTGARIGFWLGFHWVGLNERLIRWTRRMNWHLEGFERSFDERGCHLIICNHQSWLDILVLQLIFHRRLPFLRFFMKQQILFVPFVGLGCWMLDFPVMKRYSREQLEKHPELRGRDLETTRHYCERFKRTGVALMNFVEGTRLTPEKQRRQESPHRHLLKPKSGGLALALTVLGEAVDEVLDVTLYYPMERPTFWDFLCGRLREIRARLEGYPIPEELRDGDYRGDEEFRRRFKDWLGEIWRRKDEQLQELREGADG